MGRRRRFRVDSLEDVAASKHVALPEAERRHARVLRLRPGDEVEVFDGAQRVWLGRLDEDGRSVVLVEPETPARPARPRLILATAWPKGKRAAVLVEKCAELGVDEIVPLRCVRSVVVKEAGAAGLERLRRIAAEAAKQSGRADVPAITTERTIPQLLEALPDGTTPVLLDPRADASLATLLRATAPDAARCILVGPEGGFTADEVREAGRLGARAARLGANVLRVETAAIAACAIANAT